MAKKDEHFEITFDSGAWDADTQKDHLHGKHAYTKGVAEIQHSVTALDRYDDFAEMSIPVSAYRKHAGDYGIEYDANIHVSPDAVLKKHQVTAAKRFLGQLRGFGLLADVVGSGKTYEAGVVLSELAAKGRLRSLLIVVPGQVLDAWVDVMENKFGMGHGALYQVRSKGEETLPPEKTLGSIVDKIVSANGEKRGEYIYPQRPIIVDVEVFAKWRNPGNVVFEAIVVDEAHHLSEEEGEYARAMQLLSEMMVAKKAANSTYCLLLSATPHSGNLVKMFRLWYFIRCKGGNPGDFAEKDDRERTEEYLREKEYYLNYICNGAKNVSEYIRRTKLDQFADGTENREAFDGWLSEHKYPDFGGMSEYARSAALDAYLGENAEGRDAIRRKVLLKVANSYHNTVMRSIMIRQPNDLSQKKNILSVLYFPMKNPVSKLSLILDEPSGLKVTLDYTKTDEFNMPFVRSKLHGDDFNGSLKKFIDELVDYDGGAEGERNAEKHSIYRGLMNKVLAALKEKADKENLFSKTKYVPFYNSVFDHLAKDKWYTLSVLPAKYEDGAKLGYKYEYLKRVISENPQSRIVVFFDYELPKKKSVVDEVTAALQADFKKRIIVSDSDKQAAIIKKFDAKEDAVLIVRKADFTEGANLQSSNIIVNYQVTPDPQAMDQRIGRIFRLGQKYNVFIHSLADLNELEGYALGYFSGIGLMSSNNGDATILAGSNSDNMVAVRCPECGAASIEIMSRVEYEELKRKFDEDPENSPLLCRHPTKENTAVGPVEKEEFSARDFKCDKCGHTIRRLAEEEGYHCSSMNESGERGNLCTDERPGGEKRVIYCSKLCAMRHCKFFRSPAMKGKCAVLNAYAGQCNISAARLEMLCEGCTNSRCPVKCRFKADVTGIASCSTCNESGCDPKPYALRFNDKWEADCPKCGKTLRGKLKPIVPSTFATYIRELWKYEHDSGESFSANLRKEMDRVAEIKAILSLDEENK